MLPLPEKDHRPKQEDGDGQRGDDYRCTMCRDVNRPCDERSVPYRAGLKQGHGSINLIRMEYSRFALC
jgi:hypothetical protein